MALQGGGGSKTKPKAAPTPPLVSEHGQGGGTGGNDVGAIPTPAETGTDTTQGTGYPDTPAAAGAGDSANDANTSGGGDSHGGSVPIDWSAMLGEYGLPQDVINELNRIFATTGDINQAIPIAQAYIRGTPWYAQTYPSIQQGINAGLFSDEQGYRTYQNQVTQIYSQYFNRAPTTAEFTQYIQAGQSVNRVAAGFQAAAIKGNFGDPLKGEFSDDELTALANQQAGIDTALGQKIATEADLFTKINPLYQNFYGTGVTRTDLDTLLKNGTDPNQVAQSFAVEENINAMNPAVRDLFTPQEIRQVALDQAGGITQDGGQLKNLMDLSLQLNPIYHQYTGAGVSRQEVQDAFTNGLDANTVGKQFAGAAFINANKGDIQQNAGAFGDTGQLTDAQLKAFGEENAGLDTPLGQAAAAAYQKTLDRFHSVFKGVLGSPSLSFTNGTLAGPASNKQPDVPA